MEEGGCTGGRQNKGVRGRKAVGREVLGEGGREGRE